MRQPKNSAKKRPVPIEGQEPVSTEIQLFEATVTIVPSLRKKVSLTRVFLKGKLSIIDVDKFMDEILPLYKEYEFIEFILEEVDQLDLSFIQALYYLQHYQSESHKVDIATTLPTHLKKIIANAGFNSLLTTKN